MREIKFRGWNGKEMIYYNHWFTLERQSVLCFEEIEHHSYVDNSDVDFPKRIILMQFTGLLDRNGKEIYEGDIIRKGNDDIDIVMFGNIGYDGDRNGLTGFGLKSDYEEKENFFELQYYDEPDGYEVIGNIYENPELLKDTQ